MAETKNKPRRKPRILILFRIALIFTLAMILSIVLYLIAGEKYMKDHAAEKGMEIANVAKQAAIMPLDKVNNISDITPELAADCRDYFRRLCKQVDLKHLYLVSVDIDDNVTYYIAAAADDEQDAIIQQKFPYGTIVNRPDINDKAKDVLYEGKTESYQFSNDKDGGVVSYIFPVHPNDSDRVVGLMGIDYDISMVNKEMINERNTLIAIIGLMFVVALVLSLALVWRFVLVPINKLSENMRNFINEKNFNPPKSWRFFSDEISDIEDSFTKMAEDISDYIADIESLSVERAQSHAQIDIAKRIQCGIVPVKYEIIGNKCSADGMAIPAIEVGGDFYDVFYIDDNNLCVVIGDISGKSISAALFMMMVKTAIRRSIINMSSISEALQSVNSEICRSNPENMFATVFVAVLDVSTGVLRYTNAGHDSPLILKKEPYYLEADTGIALGIFDDVDIVEDSIQLSDGEGILMYTDGVTESVNKDKIQFGTDRLKEVIITCRKDNDDRYDSRLLAETIAHSVKEYAKDLEQFDDITSVVLLYQDNDEGRMSFTPELSAFDKIRDIMLEALGDSDASREKILACEEIFVNIVNYSGATNINCVCQRHDGILSIELKDDGIEFNPVKALIKDKDFLELDTGGMGIKLARLYSKEMLYSYKDGKNSIILKFDI